MCRLIGHRSKSLSRSDPPNPLFVHQLKHVAEPHRQVSLLTYNSRDRSRIENRRALQLKIVCASALGSVLHN